MEEELRITDKWGKSRKAIKLVCEHCGEEFISRTYSNKKNIKFCSPSCAYSEKVKQGNTETICSQCGCSFYKKNSSLTNSKSGLFFCTRSCKDKGQKLTSNIQEIWPDHYGTGYKALIDIIKCKVCGIEDHWKLSIHHIDGNHFNNVINNLEVVCFNCHSTRHSKILRGIRVLDYKYLTPLQEVEKLDSNINLWAADVIENIQLLQS